MVEKKSVTVNIYGNEYTLKGEADPQYIAELAKFVDAKMGEIGKKSSAPAAKVAILASMNLADELHRLEKTKAEHLKLIETLEKNLLEMKKSSDGSLKHTLELKEQVDRFKVDAGENTKMADEARTEVKKIMKERNEALQKSEELAQEIETLKQELEGLKPELEDLRESLDAEKKKGRETQEEADRLQAEELESLRKSLDAEKKKNQETQEEADRLQAEELESLRKSLDTEKKKNQETQEEVDQLKAELNESQSELEMAMEDLEKIKAVPPAVEPKTAPSFLPTNEKLQALFRKIDAVLEL